MVGTVCKISGLVWIFSSNYCEVDARDSVFCQLFQDILADGTKESVLFGSVFGFCLTDPEVSKATLPLGQFSVRLEACLQPGFQDGSWSNTVGSDPNPWRSLLSKESSFPQVDLLFRGSLSGVLISLLNRPRGILSGCLGYCFLLVFQ